MPLFEKQGTPPPSSPPKPAQSQAQGATKADLNTLALKGERQRGGAWRLLFFSFLLLATVLAGNFGLRYGFAPYLERQIDAVDKKIDDLSKFVSAEEQQRFTKFYFQIRNLEQILTQHALTSRMITLIERTTHERVAIQSFSFILEQNKIDLRAVTPSYESLIQQLEGYNTFPEIASFTLNNIGKENNQVTFNVTIYLAPSFLRS